MVKSDFFMANDTEESIVTDLESKEAMKYCDLPSTSKEITFSSETTIGRTFKLWGAIGVITKFSE